MRPKLKEFLAEAVHGCVRKGLLPEEELPDWQLEPPKTREHGDYASNLALLLAPRLKKNPREAAQLLLSNLPPRPDLVDRMEIAGPGFINLFVSDALRREALGEMLERRASFGCSARGEGRQVEVEFVSANPTGPLTIGHGRQAVLGDAIARLLEATGHKVTREYYYNDAGRQMKLLAASTRARYLEALGKPSEFPEEGYQGEYIAEIANRIVEQQGDAWAGEDPERFKVFAEEAIFAGIRETLDRLGIIFDVYFNETSLYEDGSVQTIIDTLRSKGCTYEKDGALWFRGTDFDLDKDRVIVKSTGEPTYRLPDMAYHVNKLRRGFDMVVDIFGADHESTYRDVLAGLRALGEDTSRIRVLIHQFVTLLKDGQPVRMGKRTANFVTLDELIEEVGVDAVRFFFLQRRHDAHLDFDLDLAKKESDENPVYYVQYAYARIASVLREAEAGGVAVPSSLDECHAERLVEEDEKALIHLLVEYPELVDRAATAIEPHRVVFYLLDVARSFHGYYNRCRILSDDAETTAARLGLVQAVQSVIASGLSMLGVRAPERM
ncbi:MAG: arginine--tRNA ligase [Deltaproteobacteria bacterium]|nr:arginine--tRNA ligase [Deltaproteobacteria bacterium]